ncbi:hypothetical protein C8R43DRAFT_1073047 [Mycena crocata]|nr:hypothetical protein C8R43DRAFT_1073047 [Mycena crocata]
MAEGSSRDGASIPMEQTGLWKEVRASVTQVLEKLIPPEILASHDLPDNGAELVEAVPVEELGAAANLLLDIWDHLQSVDRNRLACMRLASRAANLLLSVVEEVQDMQEKGLDVKQALAEPMEKAVEAFIRIRDVLIRLADQSFLMRYLKRDEILREIADCDALLGDVLTRFSLSVQIRILKEVQAREMHRHADNRTLLDAVSSEQLGGVSTSADTDLNIHQGHDADVPPPYIANKKDDPAAAVTSALRSVYSKQNSFDVAQDMADLRSLLRTALAQKSEAEMLRVLQVGRAEIPEALKTLQRELDSVPALTTEEKLQRVSGVKHVNILDREFMESGIESLRTQHSNETLPSWTITQYEIDRGEKIGSGVFCDVYKGTWRGRAVAIKYLKEAAPRGLFLRELHIWIGLKHPHVLEFYGANAGSDESPAFLVCPYQRFGSLPKFLQRRVTEHGDAAQNGREGDLLRFMHEVALGMEFLHGQSVVHGDLKAANVLVDDGIRCLIADFGQSGLKDEVYQRNTERPSQLSSSDGLLHWIAPEQLTGSGLPTPQTDVYSYAICCVEILLMGRPLRPMRATELMTYLRDEDNTRPEIPSTRFDSPELQRLIRASWDTNPAVRPDFSNIVKTTQHLQRAAEIQSHSSPSAVSVVSVSSAGTERPPPRRSASIRTEQSADEDSPLRHIDNEGYESPVPQNERIAETRNERRYRLLLSHDFHPSLYLPLWNPVPVTVGAVGFLDKASGSFVTLFNCRFPHKAGDGDPGLPSLHGYGRVSTGSQRQDKRTAAQRGLDNLSGLLTFKKGTSPTSSSRRYSFPLRSGHKTAYLCTETAMYHYLDNLQAPKSWFTANADAIVHKYGTANHILKEDLCLIIGTLDTPDYALFVNHNLPDGQVHFNIFSSRKAGQPWGNFTTSEEVEKGRPPSHEEPVRDSSRSASKVSRAGGPWNTVLVACLRFRVDSTEPTSLRVPGGPSGAAPTAGTKERALHQTAPSGTSTAAFSDTLQELTPSTNATSRESMTPSSPSPLSTKSHFPIIYPVTAAPSSIAFRSTDTKSLDGFNGGGVVVSLYSADDAVAWLEAHYDDPLLQALRARNFEGPIAVQLSPQESALAVFGSIADAHIPEIARTLAQVSGFAVMVRSSVDNPIDTFIPSKRSQTSSDDDTYRVKSNQPASRLRGGAEDAADDDVMPKWEGKYHNATVDLRIKLNDTKAYDVNVCSYIRVRCRSPFCPVLTLRISQFKTQSLASSNPSVHRPQPEVLSFVSTEVKLRRGETLLDRSYSNLGFLVHRPRSIVKCDFLEMGYEPPDVKLKHVSQKNTTTTGGAGFGLSGIVPGFTANATYARGGAETLESADEKPMPRCSMRYDVGESWEREEAEKLDKDFQSYDISWLPASDRDNIAYEMRVDFGLGLFIRKNKPELPSISSVLRNQIMVWVYDPDLRAKCRGVLLLTSTYIPNALTNDCLMINERTVTDLKKSWSKDPPLAENAETRSDAAVSVAVTSLDKSQKKRTLGRFNKLAGRLSLKGKANTSKNAGKTPELPMLETVARGWDATNKIWRNVGWTALDQDFQRVHETSGNAAWKLQWHTELVAVQETHTTGAAADVIPAIVVPDSVPIPDLYAPPMGMSSTSSVTTDTSDNAHSSLFDTVSRDAGTLSTSLASTADLTKIGSRP